jgi:hypothetical protein
VRVEPNFYIDDRGGAKRTAAVESSGPAGERLMTPPSVALMRTRASLAGHPVHAMLVHFPLAFLVGAFVVTCSRS